MSMKGESIIPIKISNIIEDNYNLKSFPQIKIKKSGYIKREYQIKVLEHLALLLKQALIDNNFIQISLDLMKKDVEIVLPLLSEYIKEEWQKLSDENFINNFQSQKFVVTLHNEVCFSILYMKIDDVCAKISCVPPPEIVKHTMKNIEELKNVVDVNTKEFFDDIYNRINRINIYLNGNEEYFNKAVKETNNLIISKILTTEELINSIISKFSSRSHIGV